MYYLRKPFQQRDGRGSPRNQCITKGTFPFLPSIIGETETIAEYSERHHCQRKGNYELVNQTESHAWMFWLRVVGPVPIMRPKDHQGEKVDNTASFQKLIEV